MQNANVTPSQVAPQPPQPQACSVCGAPATQACSCCLVQFYCSPNCQSADWKRGHPAKCATAIASTVLNHVLVRANREVRAAQAFGDPLVDWIEQLARRPAIREQYAHIKKRLIDIQIGNQKPIAMRELREKLEQRMTIAVMQLHTNVFPELSLDLLSDPAYVEAVRKERADTSSFTVSVKLVEADEFVQFGDTSVLKGQWDDPCAIRLACEVSCSQSMRGYRVTILELTVNDGKPLTGTERRRDAAQEKQDNDFFAKPHTPAEVQAYFQQQALSAAASQAALRPRQ